MTTVITRQPLQTLSMSSTQRGPRRLSARLQEKEEAQPQQYAAATTQTPGQGKNGIPTRKAQDRPPVIKKRRIVYDEEDDGFMFARAQGRTALPSLSKDAPIPKKKSANEKSNGQAVLVREAEESETREPLRKRRNRMSFSTPNIKVQKPVRRSKRLSDEAEQRDGSPQQKVRTYGPVSAAKPAQCSGRHTSPKRDMTARDTDTCEERSETKIALPFADTPVIRKNKAMRDRQSGKGQRRSSLGLRGRRASSLIDSGNSNALPHDEVDVIDYYKHIESEGLSEPRRMRQLLTWCATKVLGGQQEPASHWQTAYEDHSARLAGRVIKEELLKDFSNRSEMSDWFSREDEQEPVKPLPYRPNPKNLQNAAKIQELQEQIKRLRCERQSLEALLRPPEIPSMLSLDSLQQSPSHAHPPLPIDTSLLSPSDVTIFQRIHDGNTINPTAVSLRINTLSSSLGPTIDAFADGIHKIAGYRETAERLASGVLAVCAQKLDERDRESRRRAIGDRSKSRNDLSGQPSDGRDGDLTSVLRSLSRIDR